MWRSADVGPRQPVRGLFRVLAVLLTFVWAPGNAQEADPRAEWDAFIETGGALLGDEATTTVELESLRDRLLRMRSAAIEQEAAAAPRVADVTARLNALGPPPPESVTEPPELAERRAAITGELTQAQVPVLEAQDFQRRADALIRDIDRVVRQRFAAELGSLGPSPLWPRHWVETIEAVAENDRIIRAQIRETLADETARAALIRRIPLDVFLAVVGIAISFSLRGRLIAWVEGMLGRARDTRIIALLVMLRNFAALIVPAVGAGMLFAALDPADLLDPGAQSPLIHLPDFVLVFIGAAWIARALFAPKLAAYRLVAMDDVTAARGARLVATLGAFVAAAVVVERYSADWQMSPAAAATLEFPLFVLGGVLLWLTSRMLRHIRREVQARVQGTASGENQSSIGFGLLHFAERGAWVAAVLSPVLAAIGFFAAASFLLYGTILTLGLAGTCVALYDFGLKLLGAVHGASGAGKAKEGLLPVLLAFLIGAAALPILALIWGARPSDLAGIWFQMRDGVALGGMRISVSMVMSFIIVFVAVYALTRLFQSVLRGTVLPRTRLDAGGRNAVLAGVGYTGFFLASIAAVGSTGLDLTSLAVVAGALSVGIGFGLQNIVSNFVSGIILLVERPIKEGDWIEVGGHAGYVRGISVRSTEIETFERASVILPNSDLVAGTVLNRTHTGMTGRLTVPVGVSYASDPRHVERVLTEVAEDHPMVLMDPAPRVLFMGFGADCLNFEIRCWLRDVNFSLSARSDINFAIVDRFRTEGISIPFPQREVRIQGADVRSVVQSALREAEVPEKS